MFVDKKVLLDHYPITKVLSIFKERLGITCLDKNDVRYVLDYLNCPKKPTLYSTTDGRKHQTDVYKKSYVNSYFSTPERREKIRQIIIDANETAADDIATDFINRKHDENSKEYNREEMLRYIEDPDSDIDLVSDDLLRKDDVMF